MRLMSKLLISIRGIMNNEMLTMWDVLRPRMFDGLVSGALQVSLPDMDDIEELESPTNLIKLKYDLVRMCCFKSSKSNQMYDTCGDAVWKKDSKASEGLLLKINRWWKTRCLKLARKVLLERKLTRKEQLPDPKDIQKLGEYLTREIRSARPEKEVLTYTMCKDMVVLVQARLLTYNKRRTGEIEDIMIKHYNRKLEIADLDEGLMGDISETEKHLLDTHDLIQTRGKRGGIVPVLIPQECKTVMDFLADKETRQKLNITSSYLFASNSSGNPIRAYDSLKKVCELCGLERPQDITSTNLRKYMATLAQVMNLTDAELQQMCRHLGHTTKVHLTHYRAMSPYIERVNLGKILLMQDMNIQSKYVGKSLNDVEFIDIIHERDSETVNPECDSVTTVNICEQLEVSDEDSLACANQEEIDKEEGQDNMHKPEKKSGNRKKRQKWSEKEISELYKYFASHLDKKIAPRHADCIRAKQASFKTGGELHKRNWNLIAKKNISYEPFQEDLIDVTV